MSPAEMRAFAIRVSSRTKHGPAGRGGAGDCDADCIKCEAERIASTGSTPCVTGETSDGYHTFNELYDHRIALFIALCSEVDARTPTGYVWRSKLHSDGSNLDGWFVMGIGTQPGEQITYHLPMSRWPDTEWLGTERSTAPEFDGHTSADVLARLARYL